MSFSHDPKQREGNINLQSSNLDQLQRLIYALTYFHTEDIDLNDVLPSLPDDWQKALSAAAPHIAEQILNEQKTRPE